MTHSRTALYLLSKMMLSLQLSKKKDFLSALKDDAPFSALKEFGASFALKLNSLFNFQTNSSLQLSMKMLSLQLSRKIFSPQLSKKILSSVFERNNLLSSQGFFLQLSPRVSLQLSILVQIIEPSNI